MNKNTFIALDATFGIASLEAVQAIANYGEIIHVMLELGIAAYSIYSIWQRSKKAETK